MPVAPPPQNTGTTPVQTDGMSQTYMFVAGWALLFILLIFVNRTRVGHVIIYYSLLLSILLIVLAEYQQIAPLLNSVMSIGQFDASLAMGKPGAGATT